MTITDEIDVLGMNQSRQLRLMSEDLRNGGTLDESDKVDVYTNSRNVDRKTSSSCSRKKVGLIGVGNMGRYYAANILKAGFPLAVYDIVRGNMDTAVRLGARPASAPSEVAKESEVLLLSLPGPKEVEDVVLGESVLSTISRGSVIVDLGTSGVETAKKVGTEARNNGIGFLDAPVSGGTRGAEDATLTIMVGGDREALDRAAEVLEAIARNIFHAGELGAGSVMKLVNQLLVAVNLLAVAEAMTLGAKAGLDPRLLYEVVHSSSGDSKMLEFGFTKFLESRIEITYPIRLLRKDLKLARQLSEGLDHPLPLCGLAEQIYGIADHQGFGDKDESYIIKVLEGWSNVTIR